MSRKLSATDVHRAILASFSSTETGLEGNLVQVTDSSPRSDSTLLTKLKSYFGTSEVFAITQAASGDSIPTIEKLGVSLELQPHNKQGSYLATCWIEEDFLRAVGSTIAESGKPPCVRVRDDLGRPWLAGSFKYQNDTITNVTNLEFPSPKEYLGAGGRLFFDVAFEED